MSYPQILKRMQLISLLAALSILPGQAMAFIGVQGAIGFENNTVSGGRIGSGDISLSGTGPMVAVHLDPIPLVPIAFGLGVTMPALTGEDSSKNELSFTGLLVDLQVMAWSPIGFLGIKPYAKLGYIVAGAYAVDHTVKNRVSLGGGEVDPSMVGPQKYQYGFESSGYHLSVGVKYSLLPLIALLAEFSMRRETASADEIKVGGQKVDLNLGDLSLAGNNLLLGVEVGI